MNLTGFQIALLDAAAAEACLPELAQIHIDCVAGGAGVSFLDPLPQEKAEAFWRDRVLAGVRTGTTKLFAARHEGRVAGTVQLLTAMPENQPHRAEIAKLLVAPAARRQGVGRALMEAAQKYAADSGKTLLLLDTVTGSLAEQLYLSLGWQEVGIVPGWALAPNGEMQATTFLYKAL